MLDRIEAGDAARAAAAELMRRFIANASHELRTPLFGIKGFTELYRMGGMPERTDVDAAMSRIEREAARLVRLVEDLLLLARLDELDEYATTADLPLRLTPMDLRTLAADALHDLRALDPERPVTLTGPGGGPPGGAPVLGDEAKLRQVTSNLVGNAAAHTPPGTPVRIGVGTEDGLAVLELHDEGPGRSEEQAARAFDRFYRADDARGRTESGGAGLGLAIVASLVTAHHGRVDVRTAPDEGATFRISSPGTAERPTAHSPSWRLRRGPAGQGAAQGGHQAGGGLLLGASALDEVEDVAWVEQRVPQVQRFVPEVSEAEFLGGLPQWLGERLGLRGEVAGPFPQPVEVAAVRTHLRHRPAVFEDEGNPAARYRFEPRHAPRGLLCAEVT